MNDLPPFDAPVAAANDAPPVLPDEDPFLGAAVWVAILAGALFRRPDWSQLPGAARA